MRKVAARTSSIILIAGGWCGETGAFVPKTHRNKKLQIQPKERTQFSDALLTPRKSLSGFAISSVDSSDNLLKERKDSEEVVCTAELEAFSTTEPAHLDVVDKTRWTENKLKATALLAVLLLTTLIAPISTSAATTGGRMGGSLTEPETSRVQPPPDADVYRRGYSRGYDRGFRSGYTKPHVTIRPFGGLNYSPFPPPMGPWSPYYGRHPFGYYADPPFGSYYYRGPPSYYYRPYVQPQPRPFFGFEFRLS